MGSPISNYIFKMLNPTINLQVGDFKNFPVLVEKEHENEVIELVNKCIKLSKLDWDMHETSWDFLVSPLLTNKVDGQVQTAYESYELK